ncbi:cation/H(+) antiporter [Amycolatopsis sp. WAC 01375]|uniref:cation:proton antiporter n=1 Tax=Amycolatopsis sp. WAC 01375 TaxID=2203194 RepID=UPI0003844367|nr:cation:proton antiporter [Amycolatopsis sp. WAC 01375]AGE12654.1 StaN [Amycolatopsis sp. WAC 01375]RSM78030.1 cation/H(+) antiporter [Amycolatopsis sp. WAC 01375]
MLLSLPAPIAPIAAHSLLIFLLQVGLLLLLALVFGRLAARFGMPAVVGELFVGVILGPSLLAWAAPGLHGRLFPAVAEQYHLLDAVGQIGVLLLVGLTGMQMDMGMVRRRFGAAAGVGFGGLIIPLGLGIGAGFVLPKELIPEGTDLTVFALFLGVALCVSAIPVIAKTLIDMNLLHRNVGQLTLAAGMIDDVVGWLMLSVVSAMAIQAVTAGTVLLSLAYLVAIVVFALTLGRPLVRGVLHLAGRSDGAWTTVGAVVALLLLASAGTHALGLEALFGAFVCGILIGTAGKVDPARLAPLRTVVLSVFAPLFFATAGLRMDLTALIRPDVLLTGLVVLALAIIGKFAGVYAGARLSRLNKWEGLALGAGLNARGVIGIMVATVGLRLGILGVEIYTIVILIAIVTPLMAPPILRFAMKRLEHTAEEQVRETEQRAWSTQPARSPQEQIL